MRANLVPACAHCNSASKGNKHRGAASPQRFIHPYFDQFASQAIWYVAINGPYKAATFVPTPLATLIEPQLSITQYHLENVLGEEFSRRMETFWSTYPGQLKIAARGAEITLGFVAAEIQTDLQKRKITYGENGWETAFLRGLASNGTAIFYVTQAAIDYPV